MKKNIPTPSYMIISEEAKALREQGHAFTKIAEIMGHSTSQVYKAYNWACVRDPDVAPMRPDTKKGVRPCMSCREPFDSDGIHNRLCTPCKIENSGGDLG
jgi:hypothetical protein